MDLSLRKKVISPQKKLVSSAKFTILISWSPVCTPESLVIIIEMGGDLGCNNMQKHGEQVVCKTTYMTRVKGPERRLFIFIFRLNTVLLDSYQVDKVVMEIEEWK